MIDKGLLFDFTAPLGAKAAKVQGIMLAAGADIVDEQVILSDLVTLLGVVPEIAGIGDEQACVIDQSIVDGDDTLVRIAASRITLQEVETAIVEGFAIPVSLSQEAIEARLIGGLSEFGVDAQDVFALGDEQAGEVFAE